MTQRRPAPQVRPPRTVVKRPDGLQALFASMVRLCVEDYETLPPSTRDYKTAAAWLRGTRLMTADGRIDRHGYPLPASRKRRRTP